MKFVVSPANFYDTFCFDHLVKSKVLTESECP